MDQALALGSILEGRYRIDYQIAEGGFGAVYRATHLESGVDVAIKVLKPGLAQHAAVTARFVREGQLLAWLRHPAIVKTYELGVTFDGTLFIAMELLRGESLATRLTRGSLSWREAVRIGREICAALSEAHMRGVVHRDLKPANIQLEPCIGGGMQVKVLDFGIAKLVQGHQPTADQQLTFHGEIVGTFEYMAPEQLLGGAVDQRADIYALGAVLYEMLVGQRPYATLEGTNMMLAHLTQPQLPLPSTVCPYASGEIADDLDRLVLRCLAGDPQHRYQSVEELAEALIGIERRADREALRARGTARIARGSSPSIPTLPCVQEPRATRACDEPTLQVPMPQTLLGVVARRMT